MAFFTRRKPPTARMPAPAPAGRALDRDPALERRIREIGAEYLRNARGASAAAFSGSLSVFKDKLMDWAMRDEAFRVQLFRFVDCFPTLRSNEAVYEHLSDYLSQPGVKPPPGFELGMAAGALAKGLMARTMAGQIEGMASKFIAGTDAASALPALERMWRNGMCFSVDLLGEACVSDEEARLYRQKYLDLVENLPARVAKWPAQPVLESDHLGPIPRTNVSIKISSLSARVDPIDTEGSVRTLMAEVRPILEAASRHGVLVNFDMEQFALKDLTIELFKRCCEEVDFEAGLAMQAYLRSAPDDARSVAEWAKRAGRTVTVRLVKGAYWDYETIHAEQQGWPVPVWSRKADTDACYERVAEYLVDQTPRKRGEGGVKLALGSHNARTIAAALAALEARGLPKQAIELQMLHGMGDQLKVAAMAMGLRVREYVPVGEMIPGMAYLVRRLLENTSNESWLKAGFLDNADADALLASPFVGHDSDPGEERIRLAPERHALSASSPEVGDGRPFFTEPARNFALAPVREAFRLAVAEARVPAVASDATADDARRAVSAAAAAFPAWRDRPHAERAACLVRAATIMRARRDELSATIIRESGKTWREADGDTCEAIDFCEYYARESVRLFGRERLGRFVGELDEQWYQPRGVAAVISPWNFPLAICAGMTVAALVTGNCAVVKPAEQTPGIAKAMCGILWEAGVPRDVLHFLPGPGETAGAALVRDPQVAVVAFTGSKAVGLDIIRAAGETPDGQGFVKKVVCEMGGKNAIIVDESADLDEAVLGVRQSAFAFQGQKCSACSRAIVLEGAHDHFLHRLVEATRALVVGDPSLPGTDVGPVIDAEAAARIRSYVEAGRAEGKLELSLPVPEGLEARVGKPFVGPAIFSGVGPTARIATEEVFGPVLAVIRARDFDEALRIANAPQYKLTGGIYSRRPSHLERAKREFRVGNLYVNRGITGALVGRQPFGGFGMSGVGSKAGGRDYLLQFVEPRSCCENTMRRGFAPGL